MGKKMETRGKGQRGSGGFDPKIKDLQCFLNQPNINMVLPWLYDIYKNIVKPDSSKKKKKRLKKLTNKLKLKRQRTKQQAERAGRKRQTRKLSRKSKGCRQKDPTG